MSAVVRTFALFCWHQNWTVYVLDCFWDILCWCSHLSSGAPHECWLAREASLVVVISIPASWPWPQSTWWGPWPHNTAGCENTSASGYTTLVRAGNWRSHAFSRPHHKDVHTLLSRYVLPSHICYVWRSEKQASCQQILNIQYITSI